MSSAVNPKPDMVQEAIQLIDMGNKSLEQSKNSLNNDIVLVIGNTGAGKSTLSKLLAKPEELESHKVIDRYIIRDKDQKISGEGDTTVSKTIVPELLLDPETNTAFYDLPGFNDTRNESIEIANAFFMKKVADQAKRVKLLFVINHSSLLTGETRTDLKAFLENSAALIKDPKKYARGIALVATKVRGDMSPEDIIPGIVHFLSQAKRSLKLVISEHSKRQAAEDIIDALLSKDSNGRYSRIAYFSEPQEEGALVGIRSVLEDRAEICRVCQGISYSHSTSDDFGLSVSPKGQLLILRIADQIKQSMTEVMGTVGKKIEIHMEKAIKSDNFSSVGTLIRTQERLETSINDLQAIPRMSRLDFFRSFFSSISQLEMEEILSQETQTLHEMQGTLDFLEEFSGCAFPSRILDWTMPIHFAAAAFKISVGKHALRYVTELGSQIGQLTKALERNIMEAMDAEVNGLALTQLLQRYTGKVVQLNDDLVRATSVNKFIGQAQSGVNELNGTVSTSGLVTLHDDVIFGQEPFNPWRWRKPFEDLQTKLREESRIRILESQNKEAFEKLLRKSAAEMEQQRIRMEELQANLLQKAKEQEERYRHENERKRKQLEDLEEEQQEQQRRYMEEINRQREEDKRRTETMVEEMKKQAEKREMEKREFQKGGHALGIVGDFLDFFPVVGPLVNAFADLFK